MVTSNLTFEEWPSVFQPEHLTGALLDRLTHHVLILELNGDSYSLKQSASRKRTATGAEQKRPAAPANPPTDPANTDQKQKLDSPGPSRARAVELHINHNASGRFL